MEEKANKIINKFTNALSQINPGEFMSKIKMAHQPSEFLELSKKFCEIITNTKAQILFDISEEIQSLFIHKDEPITDNNDSNNIKNINNSTINELKNISSQIKFKISNLSTNISELNSNLVIISGNLKKQKYSLASTRLEKLFKLKDNMNLNLNTLEKLEFKLNDSLKNIHLQEIRTKILKSKIKVVKMSKTPPNIIKEKIPFNTIRLEKKNIKSKNSSSKKLLNYSIKKNSLKTIENKRDKSISNISNISNNSGSKSSINIKSPHKKLNINNNNIDKKIIVTQKEVIERLKKEIASLKKENSQNNDDNNNIKIKLENKVLLFLNEKLKTVSDLIFSITFSINNLQNNQTSIDDEYNNIKNNLINMTSEISEIKSNLLKMSLENENIFKSEKDVPINNNILDINNINIENEFNLSLYKNKIKNLQKENQNLKTTIEQLKTKILTLNKLLPSSEQNSINENTEISLLKEKLRLNQKKFIEMKGVYEADINSKNLIEKLLRKNLEDMKESYEQKIMKLNKKLEEKGKEISDKNINKISSKKIKNLIEDSKIISSSTNNDDVLKINEELSKVRFDKEIRNDLSLENSISLSLFKENTEENDKKEIKMKKLEEEIISLKSLNNKLNNELNDLKNDIKQKDEYLSLKEINSSFANEINSLKNVMTNNKRNNGNNNQNDLLKSKTYSIESENEIVGKLKNDLNILTMNKKNLEAQNKELNEKIVKKDKEIISLITNNNKEKKNIQEQHKNEIEKINKEIQDKNNKNEQLKNEIALLQKKLIQNESIRENGGEFPVRNRKSMEKGDKKDEKIFKNLEKKSDIILYIEGIKLFNDEEGVDNKDEEEDDDDEENDEDFLLKIKKINKYRNNDSYEMKIYKKENKKLIRRYEDVLYALDENDELKKKMILIEKIVVNKQNELYYNLQRGFKSLLSFLTINNKSKDKVISFLSLIQFTEQEIKIIINTKK